VATNLLCRKGHAREDLKQIAMVSIILAARFYLGLAEKPRPAALQLIPAGFSC
jgi:hypothetical protein